MNFQSICLLNCQRCKLQRKKLQKNLDVPLPKFMPFRPRQVTSLPSLLRVHSSEFSWSVYSYEFTPTNPNSSVYSQEKSPLVRYSEKPVLLVTWWKDDILPFSLIYFNNFSLAYLNSHILIPSPRNYFFHEFAARFSQKPEPPSGPDKIFVIFFWCENVLKRYQIITIKICT